MTSLSPRDDESRASTTIYDDVRTVVAPTDPLHGTTAAQATTEPDTEIPVGCMNTLRTYWPAIKVGIFYVIIGMPDNLTTPVLVKAKADFYGSDKQAALAQSCFDCSVALINFFVACFYGQLMNSFGRRKFFLAAGVMQLASFATLTALPTVPLVYQIVHAVYKLIQTSFIHAYVTDILAPSLRPKAFAIIQACSSAQLLSSILTGFLKVPDRVFYAIAAVMAGIALLWAFFMLPESLPIERRLPIDCSRVKNPFKDIAVLFKSHVLKLCVAILVLVQVSDAGVDDVYMYYLQSRADFNKQDFSIMLFELAILSPLVALVLLPFALNRLSSSLVMAVAIAGNAGAWVVVGTVWAKWPIFAIVIPLGAIVSMAPPIVMALTANAGDPAGIATRLTALAAVADLASAFGPLFFGLSYSQLPGALEALPFFIGAGFCAIAAYLSTWISGALHKDVIREVAEEVGVPADDVSRLDDALIAERTEARLRDTLAPCGAVNTVPLWEGRAQDDGEYRPPSDRAPSSTRSSSAA